MSYILVSILSLIITFCSMQQVGVEKFLDNEENKIFDCNVERGIRFNVASASTLTSSEGNHGTTINETVHVANIFTYSDTNNFNQNLAALNSERNGSDKVVKPLTGIINVNCFGAYGDGTDQTNSIKKAFDSLASVGGGTLYFPKGTYLTDKILPPPRVNIIGDGLEVTILKLLSGSKANAVIDLYNSYEGSISDVTVDGNKGSNNLADGILIRTDNRNGGNSNYRYEIKRTYIKNCKGNGLSAFYPSWIFAVENCSIKDNDGYGIYNESTDNGFFNNIVSLNAKGGIYNKGSNTRFIGGKVLFNGKGYAGSAGILDQSARSQYTGIECQENYYHGFVLNGSHTVTAVNIVADMNNVARRTISEHGLAEDAIGYGFLFDKATDCYIQGLSTSATKKKGRMTQFAYYVSNKCFRNYFSIIEESQLKEGVNAAGDNNTFLVKRRENKQGIVSDKDFTIIQSEIRNVLTLPTISTDRTIFLPSTDAGVARIVLYNRNKNLTFHWKTNMEIETSLGQKITTLENNTVYVLEPFGQDWFITSAYKG